MCRECGDDCSAAPILYSSISRSLTCTNSYVVRQSYVHTNEWCETECCISLWDTESRGHLSTIDSDSKKKRNSSADSLALAYRSILTSSKTSWLMVRHHYHFTRRLNTARSFVIRCSSANSLYSTARFMPSLATCIAGNFVHLAEISNVPTYGPIKNYLTFKIIKLNPKCKRNIYVNHHE